MAKRASTKEAESKPKFETPSEGDWISVTFDGHRNSWWGPLYYRKEIEDSEKGAVEGACVFTETWSEAGKLSVRFEDVEFWCVWEGETGKEYEERKKLIIAELQSKKLPIDPLDSFTGENAIQGMWSKPKIGPAMKVVPVEGKFTRPNDGDMVEVHARNYMDSGGIGIYLEEADRIYSREPLIERQIWENGKTEIHYDKKGRVRYGVPTLPFAEWIQFRTLDKDRKPINNEWSHGPHYEEWKKEEEERMRRKTEEEKTIQFLQWNKWIDDEIHNASNTAERIVFLRNQLKAEKGIPLPESELRIERLESKLSHYEEVLRVEKEPLVAMNAAEEFPSIKYPYIKEDLYECLKSIEPQLSFDTFNKRLGRGAGNPEGPTVEGVPIEMIEISGVPRISRKSFEATEEVIKLRLKAKEAWKKV